MRTTIGALAAVALLVVSRASFAEEPDVKALLATFKEAMKSDDATARVAAVAAVSVARDKKIAAALFRHSRDSDPGVRAAVCRAIGAQGDARTVAKLCRLLETEKDPAVLVAMCEGIGKARSARSVEALADTAKDRLNVCEEEEVVTAAIHALGEIRHVTAVEELVDLCRRTDRRTWTGPGQPAILSAETKAWLEEIRPHTLVALTKLTGQPYRRARTWERWWREARRGFEVLEGPEDLSKVERFQDDGYGFRMTRPAASWTWSRPAEESAIIELAHPRAEGKGPPVVRIVVFVYEDVQSAEERALTWDGWARDNLSGVTDQGSREIPFGGERGAREWSAKGRRGSRAVHERRIIVRSGDFLFEVHVTADAAVPDELEAQIRKALRTFSFS